MYWDSSRESYLFRNDSYFEGARVIHFILHGISTLTYNSIKYNEKTIFKYLHLSIAERTLYLLMHFILTFKTEILTWADSVERVTFMEQHFTID